MNDNQNVNVTAEKPKAGMKNKNVNMLIVAMCLLSAMAVILIVFLLDSRDTLDEHIMVRENGVTESVMTVKDLMLTPGAEKQYEVDLACRVGGTYHVSIGFIETENGGLKNFVDVKVLYGDEEIFNGKLTELIDDGKTVELTEELHSEEPVTLTFIYSMSLEVGNEAQGTTADFDVKFTIEKT